VSSWSTGASSVSRWGTRDHRMNSRRNTPVTRAEMTSDHKQPTRLEKNRNMSFTVVDRGNPVSPQVRAQRRVVNLHLVMAMRLPSESLMRLLSVTVYLVFLARVTRGLSVATWVLEL